MYKHLLIATDGSELSGRGVRHGLGLAKALGAKVTVCTTTNFVAAVTFASQMGSGPISSSDIQRVADTAAEAILGPVRTEAEAQGIACEGVHVFERGPADGILETAAAKGCDLIVMSSHGRRGVRRALLGSQASEVTSRSPIPVLVVR